MAQQTDIFNVKDKLPDVERGSFLVYAPKSFPKNSRWLVAEYKEDVKGFYSESSEIFLDDVTHWCKLPDEPKPMAQQTAVEWLMTQLPLGLKITIAEKLEQTKKMEREQIKNAYIVGSVDELPYDEDAQQYYTKTYGK